MAATAVYPLLIRTFSSRFLRDPNVRIFQMLLWIVLLSCSAIFLFLVIQTDALQQRQEQEFFKGLQSPLFRRALHVSTLQQMRTLHKQLEDRLPDMKGRIFATGGGECENQLFHHIIQKEQYFSFGKFRSLISDKEPIIKQLGLKWKEFDMGVVLSDKIAEKILSRPAGQETTPFQPSDAVGKHLRLAELDTPVYLKIIAVVPHTPTGFNGLLSQKTWERMQDKTLQPADNEPSEIQFEAWFAFYAKDLAAWRILSDRLSSLDKELGLEEPYTMGATQAKLLSNQQGFFLQIRFFTGLGMLICLFAALLLNYIVPLSFRIQESVLLRALGFSSSHIVAYNILEGLALWSMGVLLGCVLGGLSGWMWSPPLVFPWDMVGWVAVVSLVALLLMGAVMGVWMNRYPLTLAGKNKG